MLRRVTGKITWESDWKARLMASVALEKKQMFGNALEAGDKGRVALEVKAGSTKQEVRRGSWHQKIWLQTRVVYRTARPLKCRTGGG